MTTRLILFIDEHWPTRPAAPWVLLDEAGRKQSEGSSEPRHWPAASECVMVLSASQCAWHHARLPRGARREEARLLAYALEDKLLADPDSQHLTVTHRDTDEEGLRLGVLVASRERLRHLVAQLGAIGRPPVATFAELQSGLAQQSGWQLCVGESGLILRAGAPETEALDPPFDAALPLLQHALAAARAADRAPDKLTLHLAPGQPPPPAEALAALGIEVDTGAPYLWWQGLGAASNLLHDEFAARHRRDNWAHRLRWPLRLAAASIAALLAANVGQVLWQRHQLSQLEARMTRLFKTTVPNTPAIAPAAQLRRQLDELRARRGRLREDDMLALLAAYGGARGVDARDSVAALSYRDGRLELLLNRFDPTAGEALTARLAALGYRASAESDPPSLSMATEINR